MKLLDGHRVLALENANDSALVRFLGSLGAACQRIAADELDGALREASFLVDSVGVHALEETGWPRQRIAEANPALVHVSVTVFGSGGPRARWRGSELVASAMGGILRLTGDPDRAPVKEALDACGFHADMVAAAGALAAHYARQADGVGQHVDVSAQEVAFSRNVNGVLVWQFEGRKLHRSGGALSYGRATVRCIWPLRDGWCFHSLMTGRFGAPANQALSDWIDEAGLRNPLRDQDWLRYDRSSLDPETRASWEAAIADFFATRTRHDIATEGYRRGINATVIAEPADVLADEHLRERAFWREIAGRRTPGRFVAIAEGSERTSADARPPAHDRGPLAGVRVLDFSWALVGSICTKTLGDLGADVIKVESGTRPCLSRIDVQVSASTATSFDDKPWFAHLNTSKRSLALNMKQPESREVLDGLIGWADVVVENFSPGTMAKLGLDFAALTRMNPGVVMVSGSVYGQTGPKAQAWGVDGTGAALSGRTFLTGWPDRDPVIPGAVPYGDVIVPYVMAASVAAALAHRRETGRGCHLDASMYEICVQQMRDAILSAQRGERPARSGNRDGRVFHQGLYPAAGDDRWVAITLTTEADWRTLQALADLPPVADADERDLAIAAWTRKQHDHDVMQVLQERGLAAGVVQDVQDLVEHDPEMAARGALTSLDHPLLGPFGHVRTPLTFSKMTPRAYRAPGLGEHTAAIVCNVAGLTEARLAELEAQGVFR